MHFLPSGSVKNNHWLDLCRASAILLVLLSHGRHLLFPIFPDAQLFKFGGFLGVEIFFVLSGFLIGSILIEKSTESRSRWRWIPHFWGRRFLRTYPSYLLFLFCNLLVINTWRPESMPESLWYYITFTQSLLSAHPSFFGEAWSLVIEEIFYFLIPIIMLFYWRDSAMQSLLNALFTLLIFSFFMRVIVVYVQPELTFNQIRSTALLRLDSIMFGVLTSYFYYHGASIWRGVLIKAAPWFSLFLLPVVIISMQPDKIIDESLSLKVLLFPMASISAVGLLVVGINWKINIFYGLIRPVARWSYSAYLVNLLVLSAMNFYLPQVTFNTAVFYWFGFISITLLISFIMYNFFEKNILLWRDHWIK